MKSFKEVEKYIEEKLKSELPSDLYYHGLHHTQDVLRSAQMIGKEEGINDEDMLLLKVAVLYHDAGFTHVYKNHEEEGCNMVRADLPKFGFTAQDIEKICGMIMATRIPQNPQTQLERIIADADLEYLGTDRFDEIGQTLYKEMRVYVSLESERQWNTIQMNFLKNHHYHTDFCRKNREPKKQENLKKVLKSLEIH